MSPFVPNGYIELSKAVDMLADGATDGAPTFPSDLAGSVARSTRWQGVRVEVWRLVRSALFSGDLSAFALSPTTGWEPITATAWATEAAGSPPQTIVIHRGSEGERCSVMVRLDDLLTFMRGGPAQKDEGNDRLAPPVIGDEAKGTAASVTACRRWLEREMKVSPNARPKSKDAFAEDASRFFDISRRSFDTAWKLAIQNTGATWDAPGAPRRNPRA